MIIVAVAWIFVVVLAALVEASAPQGSVLGALATLLFYGAIPLSIVLYVMHMSARRRRQRLERMAAGRALAAANPDGGGHAPGGAVAAEREEP
jgi:mannose/fructose/N-acetylgalactosamine-specific phosphotransferase system component IID